MPVSRFSVHHLDPAVGVRANRPGFDAAAGDARGPRHPAKCNGPSRPRSLYTADLATVARNIYQRQRGDEKGLNRRISRLTSEKIILPVTSSARPTKLRERGRNGTERDRPGATELS